MLVELLTCCLSLVREVTGTLESEEGNYSTSDFTTVWQTMVQVLEIWCHHPLPILTGVNIQSDVAGAKISLNFPL